MPAGYSRNARTIELEESRDDVGDRVGRVDDPQQPFSIASEKSVPVVISIVILDPSRPSPPLVERGCEVASRGVIARRSCRDGLGEWVNKVIEEFGGSRSRCRSSLPFRAKTKGSRWLRVSIDGAGW